jgi:hypothetical protein
MNFELVEQLTAFSTPTRLPVYGDDRMEQRNWVVRLVADLPDVWNPDDTSALLTKAAASAVAEARRSRGLPVEDRGPHVPVVRALPVDARHVVVSISTIRLEEDDAHAYLVAAATALRVLDKTTPIEDIQGIPRRFWRLVIDR